MTFTDIGEISKIYLVDSLVKMPTLLAMETSTPTGSVALINNDEIIGELFSDSNETHAATLLPTIEKLFSSINTDINSVDGIAVSIGPGAFTGLRVGVSTAQGLAQTLKVPIYSIPTLEALAYSTTATRRLIFATIDARKDEIYGALFEWSDKQPKRLIPESVKSPQGWCALLEEFCANENFTVTGTGYQQFKKIFQIRFQNQIIEMSPNLMFPKSVNIGLIGLKYASEGQGKKPNEVKPMYLRHPGE